MPQYIVAIDGHTYGHFASAPVATQWALDHLPEADINEFTLTVLHPPSGPLFYGNNNHTQE